MFEFLRVSLSAALCHGRNDRLTRSNQRKHRNMNPSQCQIFERVREVANDQEVYRIKSTRKHNRIEANHYGSKRRPEEIRKTVPQQHSPQKKLPLSDKSTICFIRVASFGTQTTEEREFKKSTTIVSKATQTPFFTIDKKGTSGKSEYEERLKFQAWNDAKFFVTNQLLAQCLHTPNCTNVLSSTETYPSTKS
ncbi:Uncharacterized protein BM_BM329 [Brugia malayi]|uniref:Bm329 n=2 Tax=Brugia TaxID=6278 RepID=A0A0H5S4H0_BRUMA|nr:Uncharacterized protein BM_BM329 [Brugia malayi]CRZ23336.1 Bm329 [Brugia malayi]VDO06633.1 unnamed protein product [Brugia timori]VIO87291.1 Uncharacterized protein BM_BM329 [Brugia malayi]